ncbi:MAG: CCA tRNA nucleotidyltransferase [Planctomycetota bacterium]
MPGPNTDPKRRAAHDRAREQATEIARALQDAGHVAYFAGGCVRDDLLGLDPTDYDVATDATPDRVQELFGRTSEVGAHFGVVLVHPQPKAQAVEVATFRADGEYTDNRRPDRVTFSTPEADAQRRDFTINALFLDPVASESSTAPLLEQVIDFVGGVSDLKAGVVRAVGDPEARLKEDHLRALRAVRFAARLGFRIDEATGEAIRDHASELAGVSRERIGEEIRKMMADTYRSVAVWQLQYLDLDAPVFDQPHSNASAPRTLGRLGDDSSFPLCLAALALDRGLVEVSQVAGLVEAWRRALMLSNQERDALKAVLEGYAQLERAWGSMSIAEQKRTASAGWFPDAMILLSARDTVAMVRLSRQVEKLAASPGGLAPRPLLDGDQLIAQGFRPGPRFGEVLGLLYDAQLEGRVGTLEEAIDLARALFERAQPGESDA